jgi:threonine dehydrogenase-like Zn-dependent dehydrogenase
MLCSRLFTPVQIIAVDPNPSRLDVCLKEGIADIVLNPDEVNVTAKVWELTKGRGADVCIEASGSGPAFDAALESVTPYGKVL